VGKKTFNVAELGRVRLTTSIAEVASAYGFRELPVNFAHADRVRALRPIHEDPFDRLLVAQAFTEDLALVTRDRAFGRYGVKVVWG